MSRDFWITVTDPERAAEFEQVFGSATVPVEAPVPARADVAGEEHLAYALDLEALDAETIARLVEHLAAKFGVDPDLVEEALHAQGLAILAEGCVVTVHNPHRWL